MTRRRSMQGSSLELLLDTICNTFGGVLFIAMLTSLMLAQTQRDVLDGPADPLPALSTADLVRLDTRAKSAALELASLRQQVQQARRAATDFANPNADALLREKEEAEEAVVSLQTRRTTLLSDLAAAQAAAARALAATANQQRERDQREQDRERAEQRLAAALEARETLIASAIEIRDNAASRATVTTTGRAPRMRTTTKSEFALMIKYGRLYALERFRNGEAVINQDHFTVEPGLFMNVAEAKPHAGIDVSDSQALEAGLRDIMKGLPPSRWYTLLIVRSDSFEEYLAVKNWLVEHGYEYRLIPSDQSISEGPANDMSVQ